MIVKWIELGDGLLWALLYVGMSVDGRDAYNVYVSSHLIALE